MSYHCYNILLSNAFFKWLTGSHRWCSVTVLKQLFLYFNQTSSILIWERMFLSRFSRFLFQNREEKRSISWFIMVMFRPLLHLFGRFLGPYYCYRGLGALARCTQGWCAPPPPDRAVRVGAPASDWLCCIRVVFSLCLSAPTSTNGCTRGGNPVVD